MREYLPLRSFSPALADACTLARPAPARVPLDSPALDVMTDFSLVAPATVERSASLATANDYMVTRGVRSLFVVAPDGRVAGSSRRPTCSARPHCAPAARAASGATSSPSVT